MEKIINSDSYHTPSAKRTWFGRYFPSLAFYTKMISVIWKASRTGKKGCYNSARLSHDSRQMMDFLESSGVQLHIENLSLFNQFKKPCVLIGNHMSALETFILPGLLLPFREMTFIVKKSLISYPVFKHIMIAQNPVVVSRENPREDLKVVLREGSNRLKQKISVVVFPQRTRTLDLNLNDFNSIGVKLAQRAGVPVVPFALRTDAWANGRLIKDLGKISPQKPVHLCFGNPVTISGNAREIHTHIVSFIRNKLKEWF